MLLFTHHYPARKQKQIRCPYCGSIAILRDASYVYGNKAKDGKLYVCSHFPQCNSYVGVHPGTTNAKGKLANKELRQKGSKHTGCLTRYG